MSLARCKSGSGHRMPITATEAGKFRVCPFCSLSVASTIESDAGGLTAVLAEHGANRIGAGIAEAPAPALRHLRALAPFASGDAAVARVDEDDQCLLCGAGLDEEHDAAAHVGVEDALRDNRKEPRAEPGGVLGTDVESYPPNGWEGPALVETVYAVEEDLDEEALRRLVHGPKIYRAVHEAVQHVLDHARASAAYAADVDDSLQRFLALAGVMEENVIAVLRRSL